MTNWVWVVLALYMIPLALWFLIPHDDSTGFWSRLYAEHTSAACSLWGFTHLFGPHLFDSDWWPQAFEKKYGVPPPRRGES